MLDWSKSDKYPEDTIYCACGHIFRSHSQFDATAPKKIRLRKACPKCARDDDFRRISSDPESMTI
jgi:hypothetical protein